MCRVRRLLTYAIRLLGEEAEDTDSRDLRLAVGMLEGFLAARDRVAAPYRELLVVREETAGGEVPLPDSDHERTPPSGVSVLDLALSWPEVG